MNTLSTVANLHYILPVIWALLIGTAVALYIVLDGFDLGVGILFPFFREEEKRDQMMRSIAPYWDGNETWLVLGGGGLWVAFPLAYAIVMPALYLPVIVMLLPSSRRIRLSFSWTRCRYRRRTGASTIVPVFSSIAFTHKGARGAAQ